VCCFCIITTVVIIMFFQGIFCFYKRNWRNLWSFCATKYGQNMRKASVGKLIKTVCRGEGLGAFIPLPACRPGLPGPAELPAYTIFLFYRHDQNPRLDFQNITSIILYHSIRSQRNSECSVFMIVAVLRIRIWDPVSF
jgi:hypothetical protein